MTQITENKKNLLQENSELENQAIDDSLNFSSSQKFDDVVRTDINVDNLLGKYQKSQTIPDLYMVYCINSYDAYCTVVVCVGFDKAISQAESMMNVFFRDTYGDFYDEIVKDPTKPTLSDDVIKTNVNFSSCDIMEEHEYTKPLYWQCKNEQNNLFFKLAIEKAEV